MTSQSDLVNTDLRERKAMIPRRSVSIMPRVINAVSTACPLRRTQPGTIIVPIFMSSFRWRLLRVDRIYPQRQPNRWCMRGSPEMEDRRGVYLPLRCFDRSRARFLAPMLRVSPRILEDPTKPDTLGRRLALYGRIGLVCYVAISALCFWTIFAVFCLVVDPERWPWLVDMAHKASVWTPPGLKDPHTLLCSVAAIVVNKLMTPLQVAVALPLASWLCRSAPGRAFVTRVRLGSWLPPPCH